MGISITLREITISIDYIQKVRAAEGLSLPFIPTDGTALYLCCAKFKNNFKHVEAF